MLPRHAGFDNNGLRRTITVGYPMLKLQLVKEVCGNTERGYVACVKSGVGKDYCLVMGQPSHLEGQQIG